MLSLIGMDKHSQITQSNKFALSLKYVKKWNVVHFCMQIRIKFQQVGIIFLMEVTRHVQSTHNKKLVIVLKLEKVFQLLLCSIVMENIQIFYGGPVMFIVTSYRKILNPPLEKIKKSTPPPL